MENLALILLAAIASGFGGYFGAYLKQKGKNLATHEDLDKLVKQLEATTEATRRIEERISHEFWDKQRQWEMKRDAVLSIVQSIGKTDDSLLSIGSRYEAARKCPARTQEDWAGEKIKMMNEWQAAIDEFDRFRFLASFLCSNELRVALSELSEHFRKGERSIVKEEVSGYTEIAIPIQKNIVIALMLARKELGLMDLSIRPQSNESSAAQVPAP